MGISAAKNGLIIYREPGELVFCETYGKWPPGPKLATESERDVAYKLAIIQERYLK